MNPSLLAGGAALLLLAWLLRRCQPAPLLRSTDTSAVAALNRAQLSLVQRPEPRAPAIPSPPPAAAPPPPAPPVALPAAADARGRAALLRALARQLQGCPGERLAAMGTAARWGDRAVLPLLQRGLRDVDPQVALVAAAGMARFRGRSTAAQP